MDVDTVFQFKILLDSIKPPVWRKIQIPSKFTFVQLHEAIQKFMGWNDSHLHQFIMVNPETKEEERIGVPYGDNQLVLDDVFKIVEESNRELDKYFSIDNNKAKYEYDFGASWMHTITFEKELPKDPSATYPICISQKGECPVEDPCESEYTDDPSDDETD